MGRLPKQPADYLIMYRGAAVLLEVKEEKRTDRITASRLTQSPKMKRFIMAGGQAYFLIYHHEVDLWRFFEVNQLPKPTGIIQLGKFAVYQTVKEMFDALLPLIQLLHKG